MISPTPATVWLSGDGSYPVVLTRGYSDDFGQTPPDWNATGYAFASQQCRGDGGNDGSRFFPDDADGYDAIR